LITKQTNTKTFLPVGETLRQLRRKNKLPLRKVAALLDIDQSHLSKIERQQKIATREQIITLAKIFKIKENDLLVKYLSDKILYQLKNEDLAHEALKIAEQRLEYKKRL